MMQFPNLQTTAEQIFSIIFNWKIFDNIEAHNNKYEDRTMEKEEKFLICLFLSIWSQSDKRTNKRNLKVFAIRNCVGNISDLFLILLLLHPENIYYYWKFEIFCSQF